MEQNKPLTAEEILTSFWDLVNGSGKTLFQLSVSAMGKYATLKTQQQADGVNQLLEVLYDKIEKLEDDNEQLTAENERLKSSLFSCKVAVAKTTGILHNIRHEIDYLPDSYYEWMDRVLAETDEWQ